jgi:hypothetical protein
MEGPSRGYADSGTGQLEEAGGNKRDTNPIVVELTD